MPRKKKSSTTSRKRTGFLDLSAELRNRIYDLALRSDNEEDTLEVADWGGPGARWHRFCLKYRGLSPNILATCKQINQEATPVLYANKIKCDIPYPPTFLARIDRSIRHVRHLNLPMSSIEYGRPAVSSFKSFTSLITLTLSIQFSAAPLGPFLVDSIIRAFQIIEGNRQRQGMPHDFKDGISFDIDHFLGWHSMRTDHESRLYYQLEEQLKVVRSHQEAMAQGKLVNL